MGQPELELPNDHLTVDGLEDFSPESNPDAQPSHQGHATPSLGLTFKEACDFFGLKATALRVRIKSGEIAAEKVEGVNGPEWRIYPTQPSRHPFAQIATPLRGPEPDKLLMMVQELQAKLDAANHQLQAASFRNGYLESQLQERVQDIKLLTDSKHKPAWWRFGSWLTGRHELLQKVDQ